MEICPLFQHVLQEDSITEKISIDIFVCLEVRIWINRFHELSRKSQHNKILKTSTKLSAYWMGHTICCSAVSVFDSTYCTAPCLNEPVSYVSEIFIHVIFYLPMIKYLICAYVFYSMGLWFRIYTIWFVFTLSCHAIAVLTCYCFCM